MSPEMLCELRHSWVTLQTLKGSSAYGRVTPACGASVLPESSSLAGCQSVRTAAAIFHDTEASCCRRKRTSVRSSTRDAGQRFGPVWRERSRLIVSSASAGCPASPSYRVTLWWFWQGLQRPVALGRAGFLTFWLLFRGRDPVRQIFPLALSSGRTSWRRTVASLRYQTRAGSATFQHGRSGNSVKGGARSVHHARMLKGRSRRQVSSIRKINRIVMGDRAPATGRHPCYSVQAACDQGVTGWFTTLASAIPRLAYFFERESWRARAFATIPLGTVHLLIQVGHQELPFYTSGMLAGVKRSTCVLTINLSPIRHISILHYIMYSFQGLSGSFLQNTYCDVL